MPMPIEARSLNMRTASELTLMAKIKPGFVKGMVEPMTYATRLRSLLLTLFRLRKAAEEQTSAPYVGPLERLRSLHFVRYAIFDNDTRLLLAVSFDHSWESYMRGLVDNAGPLLDAIFCHCDDYEGFSCSKGFIAFTTWVKQHQIPADFFFAAEASMTTDDLRLYKEYSKLKSGPSFDDEAANLHVGDYDKDKDGEKDLGRALRLAGALLQLTRLFPDIDPKGPHSDRSFFLGTAASLLWSARSRLDKIAEGLPAGNLKDLVAWARTRPALPELPPPAILPDAARARVQGNILRPYQGMTHACLVMLQCDDAGAAAAVFANLKTDIVYANQDPSGRTAFNVALTARGLKTLGLSAAEYAALPAEFVEGMEARAGLLGDVAGHHPDRWKRPLINWPMDENGALQAGAPSEPIALSAIDIVVQLHVRADAPEDEHRLVATHPLRRDVERLAAIPRVHVLRVETMRHAPSRKASDTETIEPFGFRDGISQPIVRVEGEAAPVTDAISAGDLVMGYPDSRGEVQRHGKIDEGDLFQDGTFLVVRKLGQNVEAFNTLVADTAKTLDVDDVRASSLIMGRSQAGVALMASNGPNDFDYRADPQGETCPFHAHIRRANPRRPAVDADGLRHSNPRIVRRSVPYQEEGPGLVFMAYNARIAEQYEVIQGWLNGANPTGLPSSNNDLLTGVNEPERRTAYRMLHGGQGKQLPVPVTAPVTLKWGLYLFVPGAEAIERFATIQDPRAADSEALIKAGNDLIDKIAMLPTAKEQAFAWKRVLENPVTAQRQQARAAWAAIRDRGGALKTEYGVLVGTTELVAHVLSDHKKFSVREYYERMRTSVGPLHLGMDPELCPIANSRPEHEARDRDYEREVPTGRYKAESTFNSTMYGIDLKAAFADGHEKAAGFCQKLIDESIGLAVSVGARNPATIPVLIDLRRLAFFVMEELSKKWFQLPDGLSDAFWTISLDSFRPNPESWVRDRAKDDGETIRKAYEAVFKPEDARDRIAAVLGFTGPTTGTFMSVMNFWDNADQLPRIKRWWDSNSDAFNPGDPASPLHQWLIAAMQAVPVPDLLHRTALAQCKIGEQDVAPGDRVVVSLASASSDTPLRPELLFGGNFATKPTNGAVGFTHACPGQKLALGTLLGMITALLERPRLRFFTNLTLETTVTIPLPPPPAPPASPARTPAG